MDGDNGSAMRGLTGKTVIITGAAGGFGRAVAARFAAEGCRLALFDIDRDAVERVAAEQSGSGAEARAWAVDIADYEPVAGAVAEVRDWAGRIDVLVNNAGWDRFQFFLDTDPDFWDRVIAVNLRGPINMHHAVLTVMAEQRAGRIVNVASDAGRVGSSGEAVYSACKGGIIAFTKTMAREMARRNVTVNCVSPGPADTPLFHSFVGEGEAGQKIHAALEKSIPLGRIARPEDLPGIVAFLASDDAGYITGQVISVSGGLTMAG